MKFKNFFIWASIITGILILLFIFIIFLNNKSLKCNFGDSFDSKKINCLHQLPCSNSETLVIIDNTQICSYSPQGFISTLLMKYLLVIFSLGWLVILIIYIIVSVRSNKKDISEFKKEDFVYPDRAKEVWLLKKCKEERIPMINGKPSERVYNFYYANEVFRKGKEWFLKFQCDLKEGHNPGIYTVLTSISRGEDWILHGCLREKLTLYEDFKISREMPLYTPESVQERLIEQLWSINPEKATQLQEQMLEKEISSSEQEAEPHVQPQIVYRRQPYYPRRPYYRPRMY